jgi:large conductance mechanosensitive channel
VTADSLAEAKKQGAVLAWGNFLTIVINFLIIAWVLFMVIRALTRLQKKEDAAPAKPSAEVELLTEIRDVLKSQSKSTG